VTVVATRFTGSATPDAPFQVSGADDLLDDFAGVFSGNAITITVSSETKAQGYRPASAYDALWTRDHAYTMWHHPTLHTAAQRRQFVDYYISRRTTGVESDPDGGTLPADWIPDRIEDDGTATYKNAGYSDLPFMDGIAFVVLVLWADWALTGSTSTFADNEAAIDDCLAALPTSASGCVWSDPASPSVDYGFTDGVKKTGDCAMGTALLAWANKMLYAISGESKYATARASAEAGLATLRKSSGLYKGSSGNNADVDDVWATALIAAEHLAPWGDVKASGQALADAYEAGTITEDGLVRHLPTGQYWTNTIVTQDTYQNGGYWPTPLWDCIRAVHYAAPAVAQTWASEAVATLVAQYADAASDAPYEWVNGATTSTPVKYTPHAALAQRFV
jgi:hypothetical protein